jgi:hypothetical protein
MKLTDETVEEQTASQPKKTKAQKKREKAKAKKLVHFIDD